VGVESAQLVVGPPGERVVDSRVDPQQDRPAVAGHDSAVEGAAFTIGHAGELAQVAAASTGLALADTRTLIRLRQRNEEIEASRRRLLEVSDSERQAIGTRVRTGPIGSCASATPSPGLQILSWSASSTPPFRNSQRSRTACTRSRHCATSCAGSNRADSRVGAAIELSAAQHAPVEVSDDGVGGARLREGGGLQGLADRIQVAGGRLTLSRPPGGPIRVIARVPVPPQR
jgi:hypothetical protein